MDKSKITPAEMKFNEENSKIHVAILQNQWRYFIRTQN